MTCEARQADHSVVPRSGGAPTTPAIETTGLTKRFGDFLAVNDVTLSVPRATVYGFLGHNGAGKTTVIRMLLGLTGVTGGTIKLLGLPVPEMRERTLARTGALVEEPKFLPHLTGADNLRYIASLRGPEALARIPQALERVGLASRASGRVRDYSLGMRQRLGVARCLLADPELLILDEPTNGLDPGGIVEFRDMIRSFAVEEGRTVFLSSHQLGEVERICDSAAIIDRGQVLEQGTITELAGRGKERLVVGCDERQRALDVLTAVPGEAVATEEGVSQTIEGDARRIAADVNSALQAADIAVWHLEIVRPSLEQRFLEITSRVGAA